MARKKLSTLTEQMYYLLLILQNEMCGSEIASAVLNLTKQRVSLGPGTLYALLAQFVEEGLIKETKVEGRKKSYIITQDGIDLLLEEYKRLQIMIEDTKNFTTK